MIDWLKSAIVPDKDREDLTVYARDKIDNKVIDLDARGILVFSWDPYDDEENKGLENSWLRFALLQFYQCDFPDKNIKYTEVFHGEGPTGNLRECRHTYWGKGGYIFYPDRKLIEAGFSELSRYSDLD